MWTKAGAPIQEHQPRSKRARGALEAGPGRDRTIARTWGRTGILVNQILSNYQKRRQRWKWIPADHEVSSLKRHHRCAHLSPYLKNAILPPTDSGNQFTIPWHQLDGNGVLALFAGVVKVYFVRAVSLANAAVKSNSASNCDEQLRGIHARKSSCQILNSVVASYGSYVPVGRNIEVWSRDDRQRKVVPGHGVGPVSGFDY